VIVDISRSRSNLGLVIKARDASTLLLSQFTPDSVTPVYLTEYPRASMQAENPRLKVSICLLYAALA
jgi:hypothetical protein